MKLKYSYSILAAFMGACFVQGAWVPIEDIDAYSTSWTEAELNASTGWVFQDTDYYGFPNCIDGTDDCTAYRVASDSPYAPETGSQISFELRSGDPEVAGLANSITCTATALPQEIPLGSKATIYVHFAKEDIAGSHFFGVSDLEYENVGPIPEPDDPARSWGDNGVIMNFGSDYRWDVHQGGYVPAIVDLDDADANVFEAETWYHLWIQIDNQSLESGDTLGSRYELYISGGKFGETPIHVVNTVDAYAQAGYTAWFFRRNVDESLKTFNLIAQYGNPDVQVEGIGALWINSLMLYPDGFTTEIPSYPEGVSSTPLEDALDFFEVSDDSDGDFWIQASGLGWVYVNDYPWVYSASEGGWLYVAESPGATLSEGSWLYSLSMETYVYIMSDSYPWIYVYGEGWISSGE